MGHPVAVLSHAYWQRRFGADPAVLGRTITLGGMPFTIVGVTPAEFFGAEVGTSPSLYLPVMMQPAVLPMNGSLLENPKVTSTWLRLLGRLKPGVPLEQAVVTAQRAGRHARDRVADAQQVHRPVRGRATRGQLGGGGTLGSPAAVLAAAVHPARRRRSRAAHRLRERRPAPAGAGGGAPIGVRAATRARRGPRARDAAGARRRAGAHGDRRSSRRRARVLGGAARSWPTPRSGRARSSSICRRTCACWRSPPASPSSRACCSRARRRFVPRARIDRST